MRVYIYRKAGVGLVFANWLVGIFVRKGWPTFSLHFSSQVVAPANIRHSCDRITLTSFAVSAGCYLQANNGIFLGANCLIAPGVKIISSNHDLTERRAQESAPVRIGDNAWLGANAVILPGVTLGNNCTVGAGSVVTRSFADDGLVVAGNPARIIKRA